MEGFLLSKIVIAEFDIDKGSCIRTQYPPASPTPDDGYIAEQLLPDGSEKHSLGRSFIILGHRKPISTFSVPTRLASDAILRAPIASDTTTSSTLPPLEDILTINQQHITVRRLGEVLVKEPHVGSTIIVEQEAVPEEWEGSLTSIVIILKQAATNAGDTVRWGHAMDATERGSTRINVILSLSSAEQVRKVLNEYHGSSLDGSSPPSAEADVAARYPVPLYAVAATMTRKDASVRRGGITKGVAFIGPDLVQLSAMWPAVETLVKRCCDVKGTDQDAIDAQFEIIKLLYNELMSEVQSLDESFLSLAAGDDGNPFAITEGSPWLSLRACGDDLTTRKISKPSISEEPIYLPPPNTPIWFLTLHTFGIAEVLAAFKDNFSAILTALLCGRRIVVKGFGCPSTVVSEAVLAIGIIGSCISSDFMTTSVFPYSSITYMEKFLGLGTPYVVGTLNPMYDSRTEWWDLLCDLDTGTVTAGISTKMLITEAPHVEMDKDFCREVMQYLASTGGYLGQDRRVVEQGVRERMAEYVGTIMAAAAYTDHADKMTPVVKQLLEANHKRLMLAQLGGLFDLYMDRQLGGGDAGRVELQLAVAALRRNDDATEEDIIQSLQCILRRVESGQQGPLHLLSILPHSMGGISPIANQLLNPQLAVRVIAMEVLSRIEGIPIGKRALGCLNSFVLLSMEQLRADMASMRR